MDCFYLLGSGWGDQCQKKRDFEPLFFTLIIGGQKFIMRGDEWGVTIDGEVTSIHCGAPS